MYPGWLTTPGMKYYWDRPWEVPLSAFKARRFKRRLWKHGRVSVNYSRREAACKNGTPVPRRLRRSVQRHAFYLERVRHRCGDRALPILSWFRTRRYNAEVGGASESQHVKARATDIAEETRQALGASAFDAVCQSVFRNGGIGTQGSAGGPVRHVDSRRGAARWIY